MIIHIHLLITEKRSKHEKLQEWEKEKKTKTKIKTNQVKCLLLWMIRSEYLHQLSVSSDEEVEEASSGFNNWDLTRTLKCSLQSWTYLFGS